jgi:hypothetical protein
MEAPQPRQNRVTPFNELISTPARGLVYGNRGCLHDTDGRIRRLYNGKRWLACRLEFKGWRRKALMQPGKFTELFFLDEATAFAVGHRPCALCRHEDYDAFRDLWRRDHSGDASADSIDAVLHEERLDLESRRQRRHVVRLADVPDGAFVAYGERPHLVLGGRLLPWSPSGYGAVFGQDKRDEVEMLTPPSLAAVLAAGWDPCVPLLHPSAVP